MHSLKAVFWHIKWITSGMHDAPAQFCFTRLNVQHVHAPQVGKLYVTCLHQPRTSRGKSTRSATSMTLAVNPWDVQLASLYTGSPALVLKHLQ